MSDKKKILEALLFVSSKPLSEKDLREITGGSAEEIENLLHELQGDYEGRGIRIRRIAGAYQMLSSPEMAPYIEKMQVYQSRLKLSKAALETLAIVAYQQPVSRGEIEKIRGVKVDKVVENLTEKKLIRIVGRAKRLGKPFLYGTTRDFLQYFGLDDLSALPLIGEFGIEKKPTC